MKTAIIPAQITTVEDRIVGNFTVNQLILIVSPVAFGFIAFILMPPMLSLSLYKIGLTLLIGLVCGLMAVRINEKLLLYWIGVYLRYNSRPKYYVYSKSNSYLRNMGHSPKTEVKEVKKEQKVISAPKRTPEPTASDFIKATSILDNPEANLRFVTGKDGRLNVIVKEIK